MDTLIDSILKHLRESKIYLAVKDPEKPGGYHIIGKINLDDLENPTGDPDFVIEPENEEG